MADHRRRLLVSALWLSLFRDDPRTVLADSSPPCTRSVTFLQDVLQCRGDLQKLLQVGRLGGIAGNPQVRLSEPRGRRSR